MSRDTRSMTRPRLRPVWLAASMVLVAGGCAPDVKTDVSVRDYSTDIIYGSQVEDVPPPPVPGADPVVGFPGFIVPPPPATFVTAPAAGAPPVTRAQPPPPPCPAADPFAFPAVPADRSVTTTPAAGAYTFRQSGSVTVGQAAPRPLPATTSREVRDPATSTVERRFDVVVESFGDVTTTTYAVRQATGDPAADGVYLTRVVTRRSTGAVEEYSPAQGVRILALPATRSASWRDVGTDPLRGTSMIVEGTVVDKSRVDACGTPLDAWTVKVSGRVIGPGKDLTLTATYQVGTQFGGFVLADDVAIKGTDAGVTFDLKSVATVNSITPVPAPPAQRQVAP